MAQMVAGKKRGTYGFRVITPVDGAVAQVLVSGSSTVILACGDGAKDANDDLGTIYAYCYQSLSSIPANAPAGAPSVTASGTTAAWQIDAVPGATCGPSLSKKQKNYLAIWVTYPSTPQYSQNSTFYGVCNGLTTDECGSGTYGGCGCGATADLPSVPTELRAKIFGKSGMFANLPDGLEFSWKPAYSRWTARFGDLKFVLMPPEKDRALELLVDFDEAKLQVEALAASSDNQSLHGMFTVTACDREESRFALDVAE